MIVPDITRTDSLLPNQPTLLERPNYVLTRPLLDAGFAANRSIHKSGVLCEVVDPPDPSTARYAPAEICWLQRPTPGSGGLPCGAYRRKAAEPVAAMHGSSQVEKGFESEFAQALAAVRRRGVAA